MGLAYYLLKPHNNQLFDLYKGNWTCIDFSLNDQLDLYKNLLTYVAPDFDPNTKLLYFSILAKSLISWINNENYSLITEEDLFNLASKNYSIAQVNEKLNSLYPITGTRFFPIT